MFVYDIICCVVYCDVDVVVLFEVGCYCVYDGCDGFGGEYLEFVCISG